MPPASSANGPRRLRFGIVGLGRAAASTVPAVARNARAEVVAAADTNADVVARFGQQFPSRGYVSVEALCRDPAVDAVYIATPTHLHTDHVLTAVAAGKHVIVEKPLAITLADAGRMIDAVDTAGVQLIVGQSQSYEPPILAMREIVKSGQLGRLRMISGWYFNDWLYRPRLAAELDTAMGGGVVFRQGAHHFDLTRLIGGGMLRSVRAATGVWDPHRPTEASYSAFLEFVDGAVASLVYSGNDHFHTTELTGQSEGGTRVEPAQQVHAAARHALREADARSGEAALKGRGAFAGAVRAEPPAYPAYFGLTIVSCAHGDIRQTPDGLVVYGDQDRWEVPLTRGVAGRDLMVSELCDAVFDGKPPLHNARWARATLEVSLAVLESSRSRREIFLAHQVPTND
ncbi:MAG: Gfo/Idh/MocA family oxidoreductase [Chloroflexi bacterium]|nr:Gfo/Idh/MocA family oxidoreductase [Chloroflexota bacterium]